MEQCYYVVSRILHFFFWTDKYTPAFIILVLWRVNLSNSNSYIIVIVIFKTNSNSNNNKYFFSKNKSNSNNNKILEKTYKTCVFNEYFIHLMYIFVHYWYKNLRLGLDPNPKPKHKSFLGLTNSEFNSKNFGVEMASFFNYWTILGPN